MASYLEELMAELDRAAISVRMAEARDQAGLTQDQIAELLEPKVHQRTVQDWERPKMHVVPFDRLDEWARLTRTTREWLLYGEEAEAGGLTSADREQLATAVRLLAQVAPRLEAAVARVEVLLGEQPAAPAARTPRQSG